MGITATGDIDFWIAINPKNAARVESVLRNFGFSAGISSDIFLQPQKVFRMGLPPVRIEILTSISGVGFDEAFSRRGRGQIMDIDVNLVDLEDLKQN